MKNFGKTGTRIRLSAAGLEVQLDLLMSPCA